MIFSTPRPHAELRAELAELDHLRTELGDATRVPGRWLGQLRRQVRARSVESSVSIEGFTVGDREAAAIVAGEAPADPSSEDHLAVASYAQAMDHVGTMAVDPSFRWLDRVILDLHFDACSFHRDKSPGLWRTAPIYVTHPDGSGHAYEGPDAGDVPALMDEVVAWLASPDQAHVVVRAAMAHLHVVSVHPFRDGNGRIARIVQSLVLARDCLLAPEFSSIEEYLGRHTREYYRVLMEVQGGSYRPDRSASPWVRFCVAAHIEQARERLAQIQAASARWQFLEELVEGRDWPDRLVIALEQSLFDGAERSTYAAEAGISIPTASGDLRRLLDAGLVGQRGRTRTTRYLASDGLRAQVTGAIDAARPRAAATRRSPGRSRRP